MPTTLFDRIIRSMDHLRYPTSGDNRAGWEKEWHHFCILGPRLRIVINLSVCGDLRPGVRAGERVARLIFLAWDGQWQGGVDTIPARDISAIPGLVDLRLGQNVVEYENSEFSVTAALRNRLLAAHLRLRPSTLPLYLRRNVKIGPGDMSWFALPRLSVEGRVTVGDEVHECEGAFGYHDHNWGHWLWGHDFSWEWGCASFATDNHTWSVVYDRTLDRSRTRVLELTLALWRDAELRRVFTRDEIEVTVRKIQEPRRCLKVPRVMAMVAPETPTVVPGVMVVRARGGGDRIDLELLHGDVVQILIPNETDLGTTIINEAVGRARIRGKVRGDNLQADARSIFEFLSS